LGVVTIIMFTCATGNIANSLADIWVQIDSYSEKRAFDSSLASTVPTHVVNIVTARICVRLWGIHIICFSHFTLQYLCSDAIVVWRAWILFEPRSKYRICLAGCMLITLSKETILFYPYLSLSRVFLSFLASSILDSWIWISETDAIKVTKMLERVVDTKYQLQIFRILGIG